MKSVEIVTDKNRKEITKHGTYDFPFAAYENVIKNKRLGYINWHWHDELQLMYVTKGSVDVMLSGKTEKLSEGDGMFINSGILHMTRDPDESGGTYICMNFSSDLLGTFEGSRMKMEYVTPFLDSPQLDCIKFTGDVSWHMKIIEQLRGLYEICRNEEYGWELSVTAGLCVIWQLIVTNTHEKYLGKTSAKSRQYDNMRLRDIVTFIQKHYGEKVSLDDISSHIHLSTSECCRFFRKNMGCTIFDYIIDFRIGKSMELLEGSSMSVAQIAYETGFGSTSYFIEKFRKKTGMTPAVFRKQSRI